MKRCIRCGEVKALDLFATHTASKDGKSPWCKACFTAYHHANRERRTAQRVAWTEAHPDYFRQHYATNRERVKARVAEYRQAHLEQYRIWDAEYRARNKDRLAMRAREYQRQVGYKYSRARLAKLRGAAFVEHVDRNEVYRRANGICGLCGVLVDSARFDVDHIIPLARGGDHSYANTQPTHPLCNLRKGARLVA